jgi:SAM-dependent methyltransferase
MIWRIAGSVLAVALLAGYPLFLRPRARDSSSAPDPWNLSTLFLASALTLFAELALIRWVATEVRIFAYVKNLALLLCFLGFGLGCALARQNTRWLTATKALLGLVLVVRLPWYGERVMESLSRFLGSAQDIQIWATVTERHWGLFLLAAAITTILLWLITCIFIPLGQTVSRQLELAPRTLYGYSWNLAGSLIGILAFFAVSWLALPPWVWFLTVLASMAMLQSARRDRISLALAIVPVVLLLVDTSSAHRFTLWTPYQQIEIEEITFPNGEFEASNVRVNHTGYQIIVNLSHDFLVRHPQLLKEPEDENPYNLPFRFTTHNPKVLIVGSGTGNDVAAALRNQSRAVDAVEIDPAILKLGQRHPERPYSDPRVSAHLTDARSYMKRAGGPYDLILFGLLDSHTQLSDYSNMRIDNFVYTEESFREARSLLAPDGILFIKFQVNHPWLGQRLNEMLTRTFGKPPSVFLAPSSYSVGATCFAVSPSGQVEASLARDSRLRHFVEAGRPGFLDSPAIAVTTDDWPYLYQKGHSIPGIFFLLSVLVVLLAAAFYLQIPEARSRVPSLFFFSMGAGFLLLETQVVSRLALYFGTTWQVNGIVIAAILAALLVANYVTEKRRSPWPRSWTLALLLLGIAFAYLFPFSRIPLPAASVGFIAAVVFAVPIFFAGLLFASEFRAADSPAAALGANMLGAVVGGLLENLSLIIGMKALLLVAALLYSVAGLGFRGLPRPHPAPSNKVAAC